MQQTNYLQNWIARLDPRIYAALVGLTIGAIGGAVALILTLVGPLITIVLVVGVLVGLYILTDVTVALYGSLITLLLLPFGTMPFKLGFTPTLLDVALGVFVLVYLFQWMTGRRQRFQLTPIHALITLYAMWLIFSFVLGMRYGMPGTNIIRQFAETILSISLVFIVGDFLRDTQTLRRMVLLILVLIGIQALITLTLYVLPDTLTESILVRLARIGYPNGGVVRYIEDNPALAERAIGTWVDPNALGGILAIGAAIITPQLFAKKPVLRYRWLTFLVLGTVGLGLLLTFSRASFLALGVGFMVIAFARYRRFIPLLFLGGLLFLFLPQTQGYIDRLLQAFQGADLATQMRLGEWRDSIQLISQYPVFGVGFSGTPNITLYTDVANMYLMMGNQIGITGIIIYLITMAGIFYYGFRAWQFAKKDPELDSIHLGYHAALLVALVNSVADLYYFRIDFQSSITWFWLVVALCLSSSRLLLQTAQESTVAKAAQFE